MKSDHLVRRSLSYSYDGTGLRTSKTVNGTAEGYIWDLAEGLPAIIEDGTTKYVTGIGGLPLEQVSSSGTVLYYYQDQLGSTRGVVNSSGNTVATYTHDAYGNLKSSTWSISNPLQYAGQYTDSESGLRYLRARYYYRSTEHFLTVDPLVGMTGEPYSYAEGDSVNGADPTGLACAGFVPVRLTGDSWTSCRDLVGAAAVNVVSGALDSTTKPVYSVASVADTICLSSSVAASGTGQAPPGISGFLDGASNVLLALSIGDGFGEAMIAYRSVRVGNYIGGAWFRVEIGSFAGSGGRRSLSLSLRSISRWCHRVNKISFALSMEGMKELLADDLGLQGGMLGM